MSKIAHNHEFLQHVARCYANLQHAPDSVDVRGGYQAFAGEITKQYRRLTRYHGIAVEATDLDPYQTSRELAADVRENGRLKVYRTVELPAGHPGLWELGSEADNLNLNTAFRAVHDYYGHVVPGNSFSMVGEYLAFLAHAASFTRPDSVKVVTTETLGQNAWFNHGPYAYLPASERPFAEQKAAFFEDELIRRAVAGEGIR